MLRAALSPVLVFCSVAAVCLADDPPAATARRPREVTADLTLDPAQTYDAPLVIKASNITIDGRGAWLVGAKGGNPKTFTGAAITLEGVSNVTVKNINAKGWETGLKARRCSTLVVEQCNFSDNFHDPDFGWGENGRRGGIVFEQVVRSNVRKTKANRVWDACVLVDSDDNTLEDNDFSRTSNTCLKLWTSSHNVVRNNNLSYGLRIAPKEVHARDSTSVLIESGSNENRLIKNDCTHGGDGIFVRVLNGWCSTGNEFIENDCSYANNNGVECWAPRNVFRKNKANHCSYGFWLGGSDQTVLEDNEASFNGLSDGFHNSPHLPDQGHAGIVFMFGPSSHIVARGNRCVGNNGAGIAAIGDQPSKGAKWKAFHWVVEGNVLERNRWGFYAQFADWLTLNGNQFAENRVADVEWREGVTRASRGIAGKLPINRPPLVQLEGPEVVQVGQLVKWKANGGFTNDTKTPATIEWDLGDGQTRRGPEVERTYDRVGFYRVGVTVSHFSADQTFGSQLAWRDLYVVGKVAEIGTDGHAGEWSWIEEPRLGMTFRDDPAVRIAGRSSVAVVVDPYHGVRANLLFPKSRDAQWSLKDKKKLVFWFKAINQNLPGWQDVNPVVTFYESDKRYLRLVPKRDLLSQPTYNEAREGWRLFEVPLAGDEDWKRETAGLSQDEDRPSTVRYLTLGVDSWGGDPLKLWLDGLGWE